VTNLERGYKRTNEAGRNMEEDIGRGRKKKMTMIMMMSFSRGEHLD
jgi:hypothetical protein